MAFRGKVINSLKSFWKSYKETYHDHVQPILIPKSSQIDVLVKDPAALLFDVLGILTLSFCDELAVCKIKRLRPSECSTGCCIDWSSGRGLYQY